MAKKMSFDNFGKFRHTWIHEADRIVKECREEYTVQPPHLSEQSTRYWRRAAKLYERAADFYRRAGLGNMSIKAWADAAECYTSVGMADDAERCQRKSDSIPVYYEED